MQKVFAFFSACGLLLCACTTVNTTAGGGSANIRPSGPSQGHPPGRGPYSQGPQASGYGAPPGPSASGCEDPAGTYKVIRTRDARDPGSCGPNESNFDPDIPIRVTLDGSKPSLYKVEVGYSTPQNYIINYVDCVNNHTQCGFEAACVPTQSVYQDQVQFTMSGGVLTGQIQRTNRTTGCTIKMNLRGSKP
jgi:hypothetical protein